MAGGEVARVLEHGAAIAPPRRREGEEGRVGWEEGRGEVTRRGSEGGGWRGGQRVVLPPSSRGGGVHRGLGPHFHRADRA